MMSDDLIKRSDAIKALCDAVDNKGNYEGEWLYTDEFCKAIDSVPSADNEVIGKLKTAIENEEICKNCPTTERISGENLLGAMALGFSYGMEADRPQGEWVTEYNGNGWNDYWNYTCSNCGKKYERADAVLYKANFCPNCGARMKGADDE
jgi:DNA-directed RNA polymerase subunit RPC12/RpoP